jgi:hypothetical protein
MVVQGLAGNAMLSSGPQRERRRDAALVRSWPVVVIRSKAQLQLPEPSSVYPRMQLRRYL